MVIYIWQMVQSMVPMIEGLYGVKLEVVPSARRWRLLKVPKLKRVNPKFCSRLEESFMTKAPQLFNCLPLELRAMDGTLSSFKNKLDAVLVKIPDRPVIPHYYEVAKSNSLVDQVG